MNPRIDANMTMILCVTPNPAVDRTLTVPGIRLGEVSRAARALVAAGGKGLNVARVARAFGAEARCAGFLGGHSGQLVAELAEREGLCGGWTWIDGETRTCLIIVDPQGGEATVINEVGPAITNLDFGVDALHILPSGEIWFSVEEGFSDKVLGAVQAGDLLSSLGYIVFKNQDLLQPFAPADPSQDYGLDALFLVLDTQRPKSAPRIVRQFRSGDLMHLEWEGEGDVFQVEQVPALLGAWAPCSEIVPDLSCDIRCDKATSSSFYRVRQW